MDDKITVGDGIQFSADKRRWSFSGPVPHIFEAHVQRSVPLYAEGHDLILRLADFFLSEASLVYDIGCSTGLLLRKLAEKYSSPAMRFIGMDREESMVVQAHKELQTSENIRDKGRVELVCSEVQKYEMAPQSADMIISYYTMQFILPKYRQLIFNQIFQALNWGGCFLLFEKVRAPDARFQDIFAQIYFDIKKDAGYSDDEVLAKSRSLKGVLEPYSTKANTKFMQRAGFKDIVSIVKYISFEGFLAIK